MTRWQRGIFYLTSMITAAGVLRWVGITGFTTVLIVGLTITFIFFIRVRPKEEKGPRGQP